jgi:penicillin-binding protein 1A
MTEPLKAGDRLVSPPPDRQTGHVERRPPPRKPRRSVRRLARLLSVLASVLMLGVVAAAAVGYVAWQRLAAGLPNVDALKSYQPPVMSRVYADNGQLISELATERRIFVPYSEIPKEVRQAFISAEDQNFFVHPGIDPLAILRAAVTDVLNYGSGRRPVGASTITQQVAKNILLGSSDLSVTRKAREAILAIRIDQALSKQRILELYLNTIYLGMQSYGVAAAAQAYFNKSLDQLTLGEAAFLAALPKAPNNYNPYRFPEAAKARRDWVLDRMVDDHTITPAQAAAAKMEPIVPAQFQRPEMVPDANYFAEEVRRHLVARFGAEQTTQGGLVVHTSLDPTLQAEAEKAVRDGLMAYDRRRGGWRGPVTRLETAGLATTWPAQLAKVPAPPGMLQNWRLGVVLSESATEAKVGVLGGGKDATPRVLPMLLADLGWARPITVPATANAPPPGAHLGPVPRRMADVVQPGDVVMVEVAPATAAHARVAARPERALLCQIPLAEAALVSLDPTTGRVLAMVGGWSFERSQFNRATQALRQPGSSFKPFVYLTALESGVSPSQRFLDAPFVLSQGGAGEWRPSDFERTFLGPVPLRIALEQSLNLVTVRVAAQVGMAAVARNAIAFHVVDTMPDLLSAALGAVDTTVLREAGAYAGLDEDGREVVPTLIDSVQDASGRVIWQAPGLTCQGCDNAQQPPQIIDNRKQIADPASTFQLVTMMQGVVTRGTGVLAGRGLGREIAGKTGTSQDFQDAWFSGFTPDLVTVVWVGYDTPTTLGHNETGAAAAAPIWHEFMAAALQGRPKLKFIPPPGVTMASWDSGFGTVTDAFKPGQVPGASGPIGAEPAMAAPTAAPGGAGPSGVATPPPPPGVDNSLGGLY